jgi:hypothetical protein
MLLSEHRTLTTAQIAAAVDGSYLALQRRLYRLRQLDWLDRFIPVQPTAHHDTHWVLGPLGADWAAGTDDRPPPSAKDGRLARRAITTSTHLGHTDGANQVFIDLIAAAHQRPGARLARWWAPTRTAAALGRRVHPDGHGVWEEPDATGRARQVGFLLEYDTGTETLQRLVDKIEPYRRLFSDGGPNYPLLFWLPSPMREANLHRRLNGEAAHLGIIVATTSPAAVGAHPDAIAGPVWKVAGNGRRRHRLGDLPSQPGESTLYPLRAPTPQQDPLFLLRTGSG